jgi:hypothetical protein
MGSGESRKSEVGGRKSFHLQTSHQGTTPHHPAPITQYPASFPAPFPPRETATVRVDSVAEEYAYLTAWPPGDGSWERVGQMQVPATDGPEDHLTVRAPDGGTAVVRIAVGSFYGSPEASRASPGERVTAAMRAGQELARNEGPLHPGTMPLYPVPSETHAGTVAVPLPILAVDAGRRGLYAPPRIAVVRWPSGEAIGVGDAPGFDPDRWPPPRLGDWPPEPIRNWAPDRLAGTIERFTAIWARLLDAWFSGDSYPHLENEKREATLLLERLTPPLLLDIYADIGPRYWVWLTPTRNREK